MKTKEDLLDRYINFFNRNYKWVKFGTYLTCLVAVGLAGYTVFEVRNELNAKIATQQLVTNYTPSNQVKVLNKLGIDAKTSTNERVENKETLAFDTILVGGKSIALTAKKASPYSLTQADYKILAGLKDPKQVLKFKTIEGTLSPSSFTIKGEFKNDKFIVKPEIDNYEVTNTSDRSILMYNDGLVKQIKFSPDGKNAEVLSTRGTPTTRSYVIAPKATINIPFFGSTMNPDMTFDVYSEIMYSEDLQPVK
jgi:hypothetical protein